MMLTEYNYLGKHDYYIWAVYPLPTRRIPSILLGINPLNPVSGCAGANHIRLTSAAALGEDFGDLKQ